MGNGYALFLEGNEAGGPHLGIWRAVDGSETRFAVAPGLVPFTAGTTYQSRNEKIARTNPDGRVQAVGNGIAEIAVKNGTKEDSIRAVVEADETNNQPPVAHAGSNITVRQGTRVRLDGIQSADPEGENLFFYWSQVKGMPINILEPLSLRPYFFAPVVIAPRLLRFRLIVKDREGAESFPAYVNVTVTP